MSATRLPVLRPHVVAPLAVGLASVLIAAMLALITTSEATAETSGGAPSGAFLTVSGAHACAALTTGDVRCWGNGSNGRLGYGDGIFAVGDDELPSTKDPVALGASTTALSGYSHTCAVLAGGAVRCWGNNIYNQLGYADDTEPIGDDEDPSSAGPVDLGGALASDVATGAAHSCVLQTDGGVRCWGYAFYGQLGYGNGDKIGDNEAPGSVGPVIMGGAASAITAGEYHTCALRSDDDSVLCWGSGDDGRLGYGNTTKLGNTPTTKPNGNGPVSLGGGTVTGISAGFAHNCAVFENGEVRCWGRNSSGQLGTGFTEDIGDDELPSSIDPINLGGLAVAVTAGRDHSCALLSDGAVKCWGEGDLGRLGYANTDDVLDPSLVGAVSLGAPAVAISAGGSNTCAVLNTGDVRCWGWGSSGRLGGGGGNTNDVGDDELPSSVPVVSIGGSVQVLALPSPVVPTTTPPTTTPVVVPIKPTYKFTVTPGRDRSLPYKYKVKNRLKGFTVSSATCTKKITLTVTWGNNQVASKKVKLKIKDGKCKIDTNITVAKHKVKGSKSISIKIKGSFPGNSALKKKTASKFVKLR